jgi:fructose PTS system EIIBC or EIIC component
MLFSAEHILLDIQARERFAAIREMVTHLIRVRLFNPADEEKLVAAFIRREKDMSTGFGFGVAGPVARVRGISEVVMAFGRSAPGIDFGSLDNQPVHLVLMCIVPAGSTPHEWEYFDAKFPLATAMYKNKDLKDRLLWADTAEEIYSLLKGQLDSLPHPHSRDYPRAPANLPWPRRFRR